MTFRIGQKVEPVKFKNDDSNDLTCVPKKLLGQGANGQVYQCGDKPDHVLKLVNDETDALKGEFDFIKWTPTSQPTSQSKEKYKNVAKMYRVQCSDESNIYDKCETEDDVSYLDKNKVIIEQIYTLREYFKKAMAMEKLKDPNAKIEFKKWLIEKLIKAINELHNLGYCHNDLKPANIGVSIKGVSTKGGEIKFIDMGFAVQITEKNKDKYYKITASNINHGITPQYAAPFCFENITHDHHRDNWAIGCVIYDIVNDFKENILFDEDTLLAAIYSVMTINKTQLEARIKKGLDKIIQNEEFTYKHKNDILEKMMGLMTPTLEDETTIYGHKITISDDGTILNYNETEDTKDEVDAKDTQHDQGPKSIETKTVGGFRVIKGRFQTCDSTAQTEENGSVTCDSKHIVPGIVTDKDGENIYITNPTEFKQYLSTKFSQSEQSEQALTVGGKKKHNTGKLITKERYDKEKNKLSKNVSHVRKYNTRQGLVYYIFKKK